jgi:uncharacterized protein
MNWLKRRLRAWLADPAPAALTEEEQRTSTAFRMRRAIERSQAAGETRKRSVIVEMYPGAQPLKLPTLPPGVRPDKCPDGVVLAMDGGHEELAFDSSPDVERFFSWGNDGMAFGYFFQGYPYYAQLTQISEYRNPCERLATEMTRKWVKLKATDKKKKPGEKDDADDNKQANDAAPPKPPKPEDGEEPAPGNDPAADALADKITEITQCMEDMDVRGAFRDCIALDQKFGRSQLFIRIKDQEGDDKRQLPLEIAEESIGVGDLLGFQPIEPYWTTPFSYNAVDPTRPDFYKPVSWFVLGKKTHASRLLMFCSRPVPDLLKPAYNFGGQPLIALLEPAVNMWLRTRKSVNDLLHNFSVTILKTNLASMLEEDESGSGLIGRAQLMTNNRDNQAVAMIDFTMEDIVKADTSLAGLDKLQAQAQEHMAAICNEPLVIMTGVTPSGLNASSEGEIQVWHEYIGAQQKNVCDAPLKLCIEAIQLHLYGEIDDAITYEWVPLNEPTTSEMAAERKSDADRDVAYITNGVIDPQEVRDKLSKDPTSGYDGLSGEAPGPPIDPNANPEDDEDGDDDDAPELKLAAAKNKAKS